MADRSKTLNLLNLVFKGDLKKSIEQLREVVNEGVDPTNFLNDILEIVYLIQQKKSMGNFDNDFSISESEQKEISQISNNIEISTLIVFWQLILKVLDELSVVSSPILSLEMLIVRLVHLKDAPTYENLLESLKQKNLNQEEENNIKNIDISINKKKFINEKNEVTKETKDQIKNTIQTKPILSSLNQNKATQNEEIKKVSSFEDLILLSSIKREIHLKYDLENNVNLIKFSEGKIDISFNENLDKNFVRNLSEKLLEWTGSRWVITLTKKEGQKTFSDQKSIKIKELIDQEKKGEIYKKFKNIFSDIELLEVKKKD